MRGREKQKFSRADVQGQAFKKFYFCNGLKSQTPNVTNYSRTLFSTFEVEGVFLFLLYITLTCYQAFCCYYLQQAQACAFCRIQKTTFGSKFFWP